jgi:hypothetical protein
MWASGRFFDQAMLGRIQAAVDAEPGISRRALSRRVCEWMDWRSPKGKLREMACRAALGDLARKGAIRLPQAAKGHAFERPARGVGSDVAPISLSMPCVRAELADLGPVEIVPVSSRYAEASRVWNDLMGTYHYLGAGPLCGAQIRYLVRSDRYGWLGALAFSSPTLRLKEREKWIGWSPRARQANLGRVILNSRFVILPTVEVPNLASHVLSRALGQVAQDWETRYGERPVLVETFVDPERFRGSSYQAANWIRIGQSAGGGKRAHRNGKRSEGRKDVYVYPLSREFREVLCREPERRLGEGMRSSAPADWVEEEFGALDVADERLRDRAYTIARDFFARPRAHIPQACDGSLAKTRAAYRFFRNPQVDMDTVLFSHAQATVDRIRAHPVVLAVQDTTDLDYTHQALGTLDLGPLQSVDDLTVGLKLHETIAFTPQGLPLGLLDAKCWARDDFSQDKDDNRPIEEKESFRWLESYRRVAEVQALCPDTMLVSVGDRESDIYQLLEEACAESAQPKPKLLVRAHRGRQRRVEGEPRVADQLLWDYLARRPIAAYQGLLIPGNGKRSERKATLAVRHARVKLKPPEGHKGPALWVWAIYAHEVDYDPAEVKKPISWMLLTTVETSTTEQALERLAWYARRWGIEVFHRILKSGCRIEDRQLGTADRIEACLAFDMVIAWRIQWLTVQGKETPDIACDAILAEEEWKALYAYHYKRPPPENPPTLREAIRMIAKLGGFLGRKGDGDPGPMVLWRGLMRLPDLAAGWAMAVKYGLGARAGP